MSYFQNWSYQGLYGGMTAKDIHARKGLKKIKQKILDYMGSTELAAKQKHQFEFILLSMKNLAYLDWLCSACLKRILCHLDENSHDSDQLLKAHHHRGI